MRILADANIDAPIVSWLRAEGHDVTAIGETSASPDDAAILRLAAQQGRIVLTFDRDFGDLVFRCGMQVPGVILLRLRTRNPDAMLDVLRTSWPQVTAHPVGSFVVVTNRSVRIRPLPR